VTVKGRRQLTEEIVKMLRLEEARSCVPLFQEWHVWDVKQLPVLPSAVEDPLQRRQFAVDLPGRHGPLSVSY
jgi:hypothetical protein